MIEMAALAAALLMAAIIVFGVAVRFGMLLGKRLDGALEARASLGDPPGTATATAAGAGVTDRLGERTGPSRSRPGGDPT